MAKYSVPPNTGKVRVAMGVGGAYAVWNGKTGKNEFRILVRTKKQAEELAKQINERRHSGEVEVWQ
jgi:shikimate 5-dehydrogenase